MREYYHNFTHALLYFRATSTQNSGDFYSVEMSCFSETCRGTIPAPIKSTSSIDYYIEAYDTTDTKYKTQIFSAPHITLPSWQVSDTTPIELLSLNRKIQNVSLKGFDEEVSIKHVSNNSGSSRRVESKFVPPEEREMKSPESQVSEFSQIKGVSEESVDFTGIWSISRTLSTCHSGIYSHKMMKIESSNGVITRTQTFGRGTRFYYHPQDGFVCQLIDDTRATSLNGQPAFHTYTSFFDSLKNGLKGQNSFVKLLKFGRDEIVFEVTMGFKTMKTTYKREEIDTNFGNDSSLYYYK